MTEVWLQSNRRVLALGLIPVAAVAGLGALFLLTVDSGAGRFAAWAMIAAAAAMAAIIGRQFRRPRIAYRDGEVLFHLRAGTPVAVPRESVEAFFLGQGPAYLTVAQDRGAESVNLVARLSQKSPEWMHVDVKPALGHWCDGYVTIRGAWCEPLNGDVIRRLNARLRELRTATTETSASNGTAQATPPAETPAPSNGGDGEGNT
jgi:hypothetical protein